VHRKDIQCTHYIFEGTVIKQKYYCGKKKDTLTCNIIQIRATFANDLQQQYATIKVIAVGNHNTSGRDGYFYIGEHCIFFCKPAPPDMIIDSLPKTDNAIVLTPSDSASAILYTTKGMQWDDTIYRFDSLVKFFYSNHRYEVPIIKAEE